MEEGLSEGLGFSVPNTLKYFPAEYKVSTYSYCEEFPFLEVLSYFSIEILELSLLLILEISIMSADSIIFLKNN